MHVSSSYAKILRENFFTHGSFPEVGQKLKTEREKKEKEKLNDSNNNGKAAHGTRKHAWRTQATCANNNTIVRTLQGLGLVHAAATEH